MLVPEQSDLQEGIDKYLFAYSIRMSVEPEGCVVDGVCYSSCQLYSRHWTIKAKGRVLNEVSGEGVIGMVWSYLFLTIMVKNLLRDHNQSS